MYALASYEGRQHQASWIVSTQDWQFENKWPSSSVPLPPRPDSIEEMIMIDVEQKSYRFQEDSDGGCLHCVPSVSMSKA